MEVLTHSEPAEDARQFILQMYLIDHALDCPTWTNPASAISRTIHTQQPQYQSLPAAEIRAPYVHFSETIDTNGPLHYVQSVHPRLR